MKQLSLAIVSVVFILLNSCNTPTENKKTTTTKQPYNFDVPAKWTTEKFSFPASFAPKISYRGTEEIRFAPGWEFTNDEEHWTYTFLWWLEDKPEINVDSLQHNLQLYYDGLIASNITDRKIPADALFPSTAKFEKVTTETGDAETYRGTVRMLNYLDLVRKPITLNIIAHLKACDHGAIIFSISPQPLAHKNWKTLNKVNTDFSCEN